jgi:hypothetical protein
LYVQNIDFVVHVDGVGLCLWTAATSGPIHHSPDNACMSGATVEWYWQEKTEELGEKLVLVPIRWSQIPYGRTRGEPGTPRCEASDQPPGMARQYGTALEQWLRFMQTWVRKFLVFELGRFLHAGLLRTRRLVRTTSFRRHCTFVRQIAYRTAVEDTITEISYLLKPSSVPDDAEVCRHPTALPSKSVYDGYLPRSETCHMYKWRLTKFNS